jgi:adenine-specific DNA-methyltransferase
LGFKEVIEITAERVRRAARGYNYDRTQRIELLREPLTWTKLRRAEALIKKAESIEQFEGNRFDKITKSVQDGALVVAGETKVAEKTEGLGGGFTYAILGDEMSLEQLLGGDLPTFEALAKYVFYTATGRAITGLPTQIGSSLGFVGETEVYRVHLHYQQDRAWLQSNEAALSEKLLDKMIAANIEGKRLLVFAAAKFMSQRELTSRRVEFCQLPYAIHRIFGQ